MLAFVRILLAEMAEKFEVLHYCWCYNFGCAYFDYYNYYLVVDKEPALDNLENKMNID